jgi:hypothetical protein
MSTISFTENSGDWTAQPVRWMRIRECVRIYGLSRSYLYELMQNGEIRSASIRRKGAQKGVRLLSVDSIESFIRNCSEGPPWEVADDSTDPV